MFLPGFGIGMINDDFHIAGICLVVVVRHSVHGHFNLGLSPRDI